MMLSKDIIAAEFGTLQKNICEAIEKADGGATFSSDKWNREEGGGGLTMALENGKVIEKGCVNFSAVNGPLPQILYHELSISAEKKADFFATGVSIVMHPVSPLVPIIHMNVRYFEVVVPEGEKRICWFGGGIDLTPHYVVEEDAKFFHQQLKKTCDKFDKKYYPEFKKWADDYFFIKHREETRGIGGIFFDKLTADDSHSINDRFDFVMSLGKSFTPIYISLIQKNKDLKYTEAQKHWQFLRRGRYVEFNLVYDRGTRFGLETNGRTESILLSLPQQAQWAYNHTPALGSPEEKTLNSLKKGINWLN